MGNPPASPFFSYYKYRNISPNQPANSLQIAPEIPYKNVALSLAPDSVDASSEALLELVWWEKGMHAARRMKAYRMKKNGGYSQVFCY